MHFATAVGGTLPPTHPPSVCYVTNSPGVSCLYSSLVTAKTSAGSLGRLISTFLHLLHSRSPDPLVAGVRAPENRLGLLFCVSITNTKFESRRE